MPDTNDYTYDMNDSTEDFAKSFRKDFITDLESMTADEIRKKVLTPKYARLTKDFTKDMLIDLLVKDYKKKK